MSKKTVILLATGFEEIEAVTAIDVLRRAGVDIVCAGLDNVTVTGSHGITIIAEKRVNDLRPDFDAVVIPGGMPGSMHLHNSSEVNDFIKKMSSKGALIAGICAAPSVVMSPLGLLENKKATCYPGDQVDFGENTRYMDQAVVTDGNIITSQGPGTSMEFAFAIVEKLIGGETVKKLKKHALVD